MKKPTVRYAVTFIVASGVLACLLYSGACFSRRSEGGISLSQLWESERSQSQQVRQTSVAANNESRPDMLRYKAARDGINRYVLFEKAFPADLSDVKKKGYLFFDFAGIEVTDWSTPEEHLRVGFQFYPSIYAEEILQTYHDFALPGSAKAQQMMEAQRARVISAMEYVPYNFEGITEEMIRNGEYPVREYDALSRYAADEREMKQLLWARELCLELAVIGMRWLNNHSPFAPDAQSMLSEIEPTLPDAWIMPMTGERVTLVDAYDGVNPAYEVSEDCRTFTVTVPLLGAGSLEVSEAVRSVYVQGFRPGDCFQIMRSFNPMLNKGFSY